MAFYMKIVMLAKMEISLVKLSGFNYVFMSSIRKTES